MTTYLDETNKNYITQLLSLTEDNVKYFEETTNKVVDSYTSTLDDIMSNVFNDVVNVENPTIDTIEKYFLELSNCLYFMMEKVEKLGIYKDLSKTAANEVKNTAYLDAQENKTEGKKPTVAELTAQSENAAIYETAVSSIYERSYSIVKSKIQAAQTMISTLSQTMKRRMSEMQLSGIQPNVVAPGKQILNEVM